MNKGTVTAGVGAIAAAAVLAVSVATGGSGSTTTTTAAAVSSTVPGFCDVAPPEEQCRTREPTTGFDLRVPLISCGVSKAYSVKLSEKILMVNAGTVPRWIEPSALPSPPLPGWIIPPGDWWEMSFTQSGTYKVIVQHDQCSKPYAQRLTFSVT